MEGNLLVKDKAVVKMAQVMLDLMTDQANDRTAQIAGALQWEYPELWNENPWLRLVGRTAPGSMTPEWVAYIKNEMEQEFLEVDHFLEA